MADHFNRTTASATGFTVDTEAVPDHERRRVESVNVLYTADVTVASRLIMIEIVDAGDNVVAGVATDIAVTANEVALLSFGHGLPETGKKSLTIQIPIPKFVLTPGEKVRARAVSGGQAGDAIDVRLNYETHVH